MAIKAAIKYYDGQECVKISRNSEVDILRKFLRLLVLDHTRTNRSPSSNRSYRGNQTALTFKLRIWQKRKNGITLKIARVYYHCSCTFLVSLREWFSFGQFWLGRVDLFKLLLLDRRNCRLVRYWESKRFVRVEDLYERDRCERGGKRGWNVREERR